MYSLLYKNYFSFVLFYWTPRVCSTCTLYDWVWSISKGSMNRVYRIFRSYHRQHDCLLCVMEHSKRPVVVVMINSGSTGLDFSVFTPCQRPIRPKSKYYLSLLPLSSQEQWVWRDHEDGNTNLDLRCHPLS